MSQPYDNLNFQTVTVIPGSEIINRSYNASKQIEYLGHAIRGTSDADPKWTIRRYEYTANQVTAERIAHNSTWTNRATADYV